MAKRIKEISRSLGMAILAIFSYEVAANVLFLGGAIILTEESFNSHTNMIDTILVTVLLLAYSLWLYRIFQKRQQDAVETAVRSFDLRMVLAIPILTLGLKGIVQIWFVAVESWLNSIPLIEESMQSHIDNWSSIDTQPYIWSLLSVVVIGPIVEELLFRGLVFHYLEQIRGGWFPIVISGIVFGIWHGEPVQCVYTAIMGIAFGVVYAKVRDLRVVILLHMLNNFLSTLPPAIDTEIVQTVLAFMSFAMIIPAMVILFRMRKGSAQETLCIKG